MNRNTAAFLIALLFHLLLILLFILLASKVHIVKNDKKEENRIKISLRELPKTIKKKDAGVLKPQDSPKIEQEMLHGSQLKKIIKAPLMHYKPTNTPQKLHKENINQPPKTQPKPEQPKVEAIPSQRPFVTLQKTDENNQSVAKKSEDHSKLYAFLSKADPNVNKEMQKTLHRERSSEINQDIKELYGMDFGKLSPGEQKYILDNTEIMRRITQQVLNRVGSVNIPRNLQVNSYNIVEFYLHPNGDMTDFKFLRKSGFEILDDTTRETIEYAYSKYPHPAQKTLIRYKVGYYLRGY